MITRLSQRSVARIRSALREKDPHCHWCGCMTLPTLPPPFHPDMETVDHIKARRQCKSAEEYHSASNMVLACMECNIERDRVDIEMMKHQQEEQARIEKLRTAKRRVLVRSFC